MAQLGVGLHGLTVGVGALNEVERLKVEAGLGELPGPHSFWRLVSVQVVVLRGSTVGFTLGCCVENTLEIDLVDESVSGLAI